MNPKALVSLTMCLVGFSSHAIPLFRAEKNGRVSYLLGTNHDVDFSYVPDRILRLIDQSRVLLVEHTDDIATAEREAQTFTLENTVPTRDNRKLFSTQEWLKLRSWLKGSGIQAEYFRQATPALALQILQTPMSERKFLFQLQALLKYRSHLEGSGDPIDQNRFSRLQRSQAGHPDPNLVNIDHGTRVRAGAKSIPIRSLDVPFTTEYMAPKFSDAAFRKYVKSLLRMKFDRDTVFDVFLRRPDIALAMVDSGPGERWLDWKEGDLDPTSFAYEYENEDPWMRWAFNRHTEWFPKIDAEFEAGGAMVIVGGGHLTGFDGLTDPAPTILQQLENSGYQITFVDSTCADAVSR